MSVPSAIKATYNNAGTGIRINRPAAADAAGAVNIFQIVGGLIQLTSLIGVVTTLRAGALATTLFSHSVGPTVFCVAGATAAAAVGTTFTITGDPLDGLVIGAGTGVDNTFPPIQGGVKGSATSGIQMLGLILGVGFITTTISVVTAGATRYILTYIPLDNTARVITV